MQLSGQLWVFFSVLVHLALFSLSAIPSQSDKPICRHCRQLPMTTVRYALISAGKLSCEGREHQGHMSGWCCVVIQRIHFIVGYKVSSLIIKLCSGFAIWSFGYGFDVYMSILMMLVCYLLNILFFFYRNWQVEFYTQLFAEELSWYLTSSFFFIACLIWLFVILAFFLSQMLVWCLFSRRSPVVMWAIQAAPGWLLLQSEHGGKLPLSPAPVIPPHPLKPRARGSAGTFPPTVPGQLLAFFSLIISWNGSSA